MFPAFAGLLPGLIQAGGKFLRRTGKDILAGKNVLQSAKTNALAAANEVVPGAGDFIEKGVRAIAGALGRKKVEAPSNPADLRALQKAQAATGMLRAINKTVEQIKKSGTVTPKQGGLIYDYENGIRMRGSAAQKKEAAKILEKMKMKYPDEMKEGKKVYQKNVEARRIDPGM